MKRSEPTLIGQSVASVLRQLGLESKVKQYEVIEQWPRIVGNRIAKVATAVRIENGKLFVHVERAPWRNEMVFLKTALIEKINKEMHQEVVKDIIFR